MDCEEKEEQQEEEEKKKEEEEGEEKEEEKANSTTRSEVTHWILFVVRVPLMHSMHVKAVSSALLHIFFHAAQTGSTSLKLRTRKTCIFLKLRDVVIWMLPGFRLSDVYMFLATKFADFGSHLSNVGCSN